MSLYSIVRIFFLPARGQFGETMAAQLKEATMDPKKRTLLRVVLLEDEKKNTEKSVDRLMGTKPEARFAFIQQRAGFADWKALVVKCPLSVHNRR